MSGVINASLDDDETKKAIVVVVDGLDSSDDNSHEIYFLTSVKDNSKCPIGLTMKQLHQCKLISDAYEYSSDHRDSKNVEFNLFSKSLHYLSAFLVHWTAFSPGSTWPFAWP